MTIAIPHCSNSLSYGKILVFPLISFARFRAVLGQPALRGAIGASALGRLPIGIAGLALMLAAQQSAGSFAEAGLLTGAYVSGLALLAPWIGRHIDRRGPRGALIASAIAYPTMMCALVACLHLRAPIAASMIVSFIAGVAFPPITVCMRAFLKQHFDAADPNIAAAYSLESLLIESIFIVGPALVAVFVAVSSPHAAVIFAAACALAGTILFLRSPAIRNWRIAPRTSTTSIFGPLAEPGFPALLLTIGLYATAFGMIEMGITGFAAELQASALAGALLALMSVGSAAGALAYGGRLWRAPLWRQFSLMLIALGSGAALLGVIANPWLFAASSVAAGVVMAPALIIQSMLVAKIARPIHSTEAFTWSSTALLAGVSAGIAFAGWILDHSPAGTVFVAAGVAAIAAGGFAALSKAGR